MKNSVRMIVPAVALIILGGCVAVPAQPGYYEPAPVVYVPAPVYFGPTIRFGYSRGWGGHGHHHYRGGSGHGQR